MAIDLSSKLPHAGTTIFTVMSQLAKQHQAINLSQGFPDFDGPAELRQRVTYHLEHGKNQYAPLSGVPELLEEIANKIEGLYEQKVNPLEEIVITPGATEALFCAITAVVNPGDEVIIFDPAYDTYEPAVTLNQGITRRISLNTLDFAVDWDRVRESVNDRTRLIILNTPHNPSGATWTERDINELRDIVASTGVLLLSDEVYEHIIFDGRQHHSLLRYADLAERAFCVFSFGKTYHATGWRVGYCVAPKPLMAEFRRIHQFINFSTQTPVQYALADFLRDCPEHHQQLGDFYQQKRDLFCELLGPSRFTFSPAAGTFFQLADYSEISDEPDTEFAERLTREHKVAVIPVSVFYQDPPDQRRVRFCFAKGNDTLRAAAERLVAI